MTPSSSTPTPTSTTSPRAPISASWLPSDPNTRQFADTVTGTADANVIVTAFPTKHTMESYGYRFDTADRSIVISGDTNPTQATIDACRGCDVLVHEVLTLEWLAKRPDFKNYAARHHTTTTQLIELASKAKPRLLVLYHASLSLRPTVDAERSTPAALLREMSAYSGHVVVGRDLDVY